MPPTLQYETDSTLINFTPAFGGQTVSIADYVDLTFESEIPESFVSSLEDLELGRLVDVDVAHTKEP